ncbi:hypothetical protein RhiirA1_500523 [Rhizophagus irregularis]|uniref:HMG box domain-containing protein n=1 Tax=Rhizophagus irregularis TaxID=588596 RepID=A0A2N0SIZ8_9GLOM|nr:hypothetical protein RhiirA1_500523 [Rhizophagus irregularis]CAB4486433.1 unnamed protein product [Rhizophagus irregularis]
MIVSQGFPKDDTDNPFIIIILKDNKIFLVLGPNNNYLEIIMSSTEEIIKKSFKTNLNSFFLFQYDLRKEIKAKENPSKRFLEFKNNINKIWKKTPDLIKNEYKILSEELQRLNKPLKLVIRPFNPEKQKENQKWKKKLKSKSTLMENTNPIPAIKNCSQPPSDNIPMESMENINHQSAEINSSIVCANRSISPSYSENFVSSIRYHYFGIDDGMFGI